MLLRIRPTKATRRGTVARPWSIARGLRQQSSWIAENLSIERSWTARLGRASFRIQAHASLFFYPARPDDAHARGPGTVVSIVVTPLASASTDDMEALLSDLNGRLGPQYRIDRRRSPYLVFTLRGIDQPGSVLAVFQNIERALDGAALRYRVQRPPRSRAARLWEIAKALRTGRRWVLSSIHFSAQIDEPRKLVSATLALMPAARSGKSAAAGYFFLSVTPKSQRWERFCDAVGRALSERGYRTQDRRPCQIAMALLFRLDPLKVRQERLALMRLLGAARALLRPTRARPRR